MLEIPENVKYFGYYDNWRDEPLTCEKCAWTGKCDLGAMGLYSELADYSCPKCGIRLAIVSFPTTEESRQNWDKLSEKEKEYVEAIENFRKRFKVESLKSPDQLPDVNETEFTLSWDCDEECTYIRFNDRLLWEELAVYEGAWRFEEIVQILKAKYGSRITDLIPTNRSELYLYGDHLSTVSRVEQARASLKPKNAKKGQNVDVTSVRKSSSGKIENEYRD